MICFIATALFVVGSWGPVWTHGNNGFVAHNTTYPGTLFAELEVGDTISVTCDGEKTRYKIRSISEYQAITQDYFMDEEGNQYTGRSLYRKIYNHPNEVVLQTCVRKGMNWEWGRLFVVAKRYQREWRQ